MSRPFAKVLGDPIGHSLSPLIHREAYRELGLDWDFTAQQVPLGQLSSVLADLKSQPGFEDGFACRGLALTMPLKPEARKAAIYVDGLAKLTGVVNTLVPALGDWAGFNTDTAGIVGALRSSGFSSPVPNYMTVILGTGSTAASALAAVRELGAGRIVAVSRSADCRGLIFRAASRMFLDVENLTWNQSDRLLDVLSAASLVISTIPGSAQSALPLPQVDNSAVLMDAVYHPWPTPLAHWAKVCGFGVVPGWEMLLYQAVSQIKLFTGRDVKVESIRTVLMNFLRQGQQRK